MKMTRRKMMLAIAAFTSPAALISGCGGGVGSGGTGDFSSNYTYGQITGFGSVIVNGVRFDDSAAQIVDDRGGFRSSGELKLGMTVAIDSDAIMQGSSGPEAKAGVVRFGSVLEAPISSLGTGQFVALGQTVRLVATTVFDDSLTASSLAVGAPVEVHGYLDAATQSIIATRIEGFTSTGIFKVGGFPAAIDTAARRFTMGAAEFDYSASTDVPASLGVGMPVTVYVQATPGAAGRLMVTRFYSRSVSSPSRDHDSADVRGVVTAFTDTANFDVNNVRVDARAATFPDGTGFGLGSRVKVDGRVQAGVLIATEVEIDSDDRVRDQGVKLRGAIESVSPGDQTFRLRGNTVFYGASGVRFDDGSAADLAPGREVEVEGSLSSDGTRVQAARIKFRN